jgi:hypothetical protein
MHAAAQAAAAVALTAPCRSFDSRISSAAMCLNCKWGEAVTQVNHIIRARQRLLMCSTAAAFGRKL